MGPSGSGKTTLGRLAGGLLVPDSGTVYVDGVQTNKRKNRPILIRKVGYVAQFPEYSLLEATVFQDIGYSLRGMKMTEEEAADKIKNAMESVGLAYERYRDRSPFRLSGGEKRRVALAGAIVREPSVLILDEPTAGLDPKSRVQFLDLIRLIQTANGTTVLYMTHHLQDALEYANRIVLLDQGELVVDTTISDVMHVPREVSAILKATPLIRFRTELEARFPGRIPAGLLREKALLDFVADHLLRKNGERR